MFFLKCNFHTDIKSKAFLRNIHHAVGILSRARVRPPPVCRINFIYRNMQSLSLHKSKIKKYNFNSAEMIQNRVFFQLWRLKQINILCVNDMFTQSELFQNRIFQRQSAMISAIFIYFRILKWFSIKHISQSYS